MPGVKVSKKNNRYKKSTKATPAKKMVKATVKAELNKKIETKSINVPNPAGTLNSNYVPYGALSGVQYLCTDIWKMPQGVEDATLIGAPNRVGDKIRAMGFQMNYYFSIPNFYTVGASAFFLPYVKLRIVVFTTAFGVPLLSQPLLCDTNFNSGNTSTLQPINWDEGYVKSVLYDKTHIIRNNLSVMAAGSGTFPNVPISGQCFHFKKNIKYDKTIKYSDNNTSSPNATIKPVYIAILAEVDDSNTGIVPSGTKILFSTGYTRGWFKDM